MCCVFRRRSTPRAQRWPGPSTFPRRSTRRSSKREARGNTLSSHLGGNMPDTTRVEQLADLYTLGAGAAAEKFAAELAAVLENIRDPNTQADAKRKIVMEWIFMPDGDREAVQVAITARSAFAATKPTSEVMFVGRKDGQMVATVMHGEQTDPRQGVFPIGKEG